MDPLAPLTVVEIVHEFVCVLKYAWYTPTLLSQKRLMTDYRTAPLKGLLLLLKLFLSGIQRADFQKCKKHVGAVTWPALLNPHSVYPN